jgi:hypothetical protein
MTANRLRRNRPIIGFATAVAGAAVLVAVVVARFAEAAVPWLFIVSAVALVIAFAAAGASGGFDDLGRLGFAAGAVGWAIYAITRVIVNTPGIITVVALAIALLGSLIAGVAVYQRKAFAGRANDVFLLAMIVTALYLFIEIVPLSWLPDAAVVLLTLLWGALLVIAGLFILQRK